MHAPFAESWDSATIHEHLVRLMVLGLGAAYAYVLLS